MTKQRRQSLAEHPGGPRERYEKKKQPFLPFAYFLFVLKRHFSRELLTSILSGVACNKNARYFPPRRAREAERSALKRWQRMPRRFISVAGLILVAAAAASGFFSELIKVSLFSARLAWLYRAAVYTGHA